MRITWSLSCDRAMITAIRDCRLSNTSPAQDWPKLMGLSERTVERLVSEGIPSEPGASELCAFKRLSRSPGRLVPGHRE